MLRQNRKRRFKIYQNPLYNPEIQRNSRNVIWMLWLYLSPWASNQKTKDTFFSPTLKVKEKKVPLFFWFEAQVLRYGHFLLCTIARLWNDVLKIRKWPYLSPWASNQKTKGTFFSPTLKVKEKKVPLFFWFEAQGLRYGHFLSFTTSFHQWGIVQSRKWPYLSPWAPNQKTKGTFFSLTFKVGEKKVAKLC